MLLGGRQRGRERGAGRRNQRRSSRRGRLRGWRHRLRWIGAAGGSSAVVQRGAVLLALAELLDWLRNRRPVNRPRQQHEGDRDAMGGTMGGTSEELAWELLTSLLDNDSTRRPSAAEALLGRYLNVECTEAELPTPPPEPWTLEALVGATGAGPPRTLVADDCAVPAEWGV